ncbi:SURF1 family protein [Phenylobacterium sp.]|jgi:surfeit locus 1 family protein|uniref:SURF1 family protein n=1 Tax=Phenylobacterium sp. TaxID=1871053 RepID=UPI002F94BF75
MTERRRFPVVLTLVTLVALAILVGLGSWQLQRLAWKRELLARLEALEKAPPVPLIYLMDELARGEDVEFRRVKVTCPGLSKAPYLELYGLHEGQAGSRLISACDVEGGGQGTILVDRGFVGDTISARPPVDPADRTPVEIEGLLRRPDARTFVTPPNRTEANRWFSRDIPAMAAALKAPAAAPAFLMAETSTNPEWKALVPAAAPKEISNRHLEYAVTWFGLALALAGVYAALLFKRLRR